MNSVDLGTLVTFGASWAVLSGTHGLADHVLGQTHAQATGKASPGLPGWLADLRHVAAYHAVMIGAGLLAWLFLPLHWSTPGILAALAWSVGTHALLDRRWPVRWILTHTGSKGFADLADHGLNGMYLSDQSLHTFALLIAAGMLAVIA